MSGGQIFILFLVFLVIIVVASSRHMLMLLRDLEPIRLHGRWAFI